MRKKYKIFHTSTVAKFVKINYKKKIEIINFIELEPLIKIVMTARPTILQALIRDLQ